MQSKILKKQYNFLYLFAALIIGLTSFILLIFTIIKIANDLVKVGKMTSQDEKFNIKFLETSIHEAFIGRPDLIYSTIATFLVSRFLFFFFLYRSWSMEVINKVVLIGCYVLFVLPFDIYFISLVTMGAALITS